MRRSNNDGAAAGVLMIEAAKRIIKKSFSAELLDYWTDGTIEAALKLCELYVDEANGIVIGFFRYWPEHAAAVGEMDFAELERINLKDGPLLHVVIWIAPGDSFRAFRAFIRELDPWGVTAHRYRGGEFRFVCKRNKFFVDGGRRNGFLRRQQEQTEKQV